MTKKINGGEGCMIAAGSLVTASFFGGLGLIFDGNRIGFGAALVGGAIGFIGTMILAYLAAEDE